MQRTWEGRDEITLGNTDLLRVVNWVEEVERTGSTNHLTAFMSSVLDRPATRPIVENAQLRGLLRGFLIAEQNYVEAKLACSKISTLQRVFRTQTVKNLESRKTELKVLRDKLYKDYEMFRRLAFYDSTLLKRIPAA
jgi:hypothetical protein